MMSDEGMKLLSTKEAMKMVEEQKDNHVHK